MAWKKYHQLWVSNKQVESEKKYLQIERMQILLKYPLSLDFEYFMHYFSYAHKTFTCYRNKKHPYRRRLLDMLRVMSESLLFFFSLTT